MHAEKLLSFEVDEFVYAQGFVLFRVDQRSELGTITFAGPRDWNPTWSGVLSDETRQAVIARFHRLGLETRERLFGM